jgi:hypothetical protein
MARSADTRVAAIAFAPEVGRFRLAPGQNLDDLEERPGFGAIDAAEENQRRRDEGARTLFVPLHIADVSPGSRLLADRSEVQLIAHDGRVVHHGTGNALEVRVLSPDITVHQGIRVPGAVYNRVASEAVDMQLDYWFTELDGDGTYALPAKAGLQRIPGVGLCGTNVDDAGSRVLFQCIQPGERASCVVVVLEHPPSGRRNGEVSLCAPDYASFPRPMLFDALGGFTGHLPFYDPSGAAHYPVSGPQLSDARAMVTAFHAANHFTRRLTSPNVRLHEWQPQPVATATVH